MRILLVKTSSLGDVVHNLPALSDLRRLLPEARIDWVVEEGFAAIPRLHPAVERVIPVAVRRWRKSLLSATTWREIGAFRHQLQEVAYDRVIDSQGLLKSALIAAQARLAAGGERCGNDRDSAREPLAARFYSHSFAIPRAAHAVERNRQLAAAAIGQAGAALALDYGIQAAPLAAPWLPQGAYAVALCGTSRADKLWPEARWIELGLALHQRGLTLALPAGSADEMARAGRIAAAVPGAVAAPPLGIAELAGLMAGARAVIGLDTGLTHLGAALGLPTIALFAGSDPALTGVHAGPAAINLGNIGQPPAVADVLAALP
jgi:heptosyltransferase-1